MILVVYTSGEGHPEPKEVGDWPQRHADVIPDDGDAIVIWREFTDPDDPDGEVSYHVVGSGVWSEITLEEAKAAIEGIGGP